MKKQRTPVFFRPVYWTTIIESAFAPQVLESKDLLFWHWSHWETLCSQSELLYSTEHFIVHCTVQFYSTPGFNMYLACNYENFLFTFFSWSVEITNRVLHSWKLYFERSITPCHSPLDGWKKETARASLWFPTTIKNTADTFAVRQYSTSAK